MTQGQELIGAYALATRAFGCISAFDLGFWALGCKVDWLPVQGHAYNSYGTSWTAGYGWDRLLGLYLSLPQRFRGPITVELSSVVVDPSKAYFREILL